MTGISENTEVDIPSLLCAVVAIPAPLHHGFLLRLSSSRLLLRDSFIHASRHKMQVNELNCERYDRQYNRHNLPHKQHFRY